MGLLADLQFTNTLHRDTGFYFACKDGSGVSKESCTYKNTPASPAIEAGEGPAHSRSADRPRQQGKFVFRGQEKLYIRGVTYGTFRPNENDEQYAGPTQVDADFTMMATHGINTIRTYTVPPRWLLDLAHDRDLFVMVGLPWEQHIAFLDERSRCRSITERVRQGVQACAGHPAVLCYAVGNEIPASIVRWHGARRVEKFVEELYRVAKTEDPGGLVTYVNFPTTEYLQLPFVDFYCFNSDFRKALNVIEI